MSYSSSRSVWRLTALVAVCACSATLAGPLPLPAQSQASVADTSVFRPLELPGPNEYRTGAGRPGPQYWQQRVDYQIDATLDVPRNELRGREVIRYQNNSPDTLTYLWMHVEQNICSPSSVTSKLNQPPLIFQGAAFDFSCKGFAGGVTLESVTADRRAVTPFVDGTVMRLDLPTAVAPGRTAVLEIVWRFPVPVYGAGRMARDGPLYEIAQWYPRLAVYDDVRGWNAEPYIGAGEFYLEYGSFEVSITLPATYVVAATGRLLNPEQVLTATQRQRLAQALTSPTPVQIITAQEVGPGSRPTTGGTLTWRFAADSVRDFAFAAAPNWRWDASGYNGVLIHTLYRTNATLWAAEANRMARASIAHFSEQWLPYPYPHATTVEGPIEGMEYPMLTFVPRGASREDLHWTLSHEFGHEWFPMIVGSNERLHPWMDEGFNTFIDIEGAEKYFAGTPYADTVALHPLHLYPAHSVPGEEQPMSTRPIEVRDLFWVGYRKPALMLQLLRFEVLGKERFDAAFRQYTRDWAFKHPTPADFFRIMRDASGVELDWFWRGWIYSTARLDQAVDAIDVQSDGTTEVRLSNRGTMVMPAELELTFMDGTTETVRLPVDMWNLGRTFTYRVPGTRALRSAELDPRGVYPDVDRTNNSR
jgi:hypothetical protein